MPLTEKISNFAKIYWNIEIHGFCLCWDLYFFSRKYVKNVLRVFASDVNQTEIRSLVPRPLCAIEWQREPSEIAWDVLGEFSRQARWVTSHLITRWGRLGTRLQLSQCTPKWLLLQQRSWSFRFSTPTMVYGITNNPVPEEPSLVIGRDLSVAKWRSTMSGYS